MDDLRLEESTSTISAVAADRDEGPSPLSILTASHSLIVSSSSSYTCDLRNTGTKFFWHSSTTIDNRTYTFVLPRWTNHQSQLLEVIR